MYNALMKRRFMDEKHDYAIQAIFNFTSVFEDRAGQDLGCFTERELRDLLGRFFASCWGRRTDLNTLCLLVDAYLIWYKENNPDAPAVGACDLQIWQFFEPEFDIRDEKVFYFSSKDIENIGLTLDDRMRYVLYAMYEGLRGENGKNILTLSVRDINRERRRVHIPEGDVNVSSAMISAICDAYDSKTVQYRQQLHSTNISAIDVDKVIRFRSQPEAMTPTAIKAAMRTLINTIRETCGFSLLTVNNLVFSGFVSDIVMLYDVSEPDTTIRPALNDSRVIELGRNYGIELSSYAQKTRRASVLDEFLDLYRDKIAANQTDKDFSNL